MSRVSLFFQEHVLVIPRSQTSEKKLTACGDSHVQRQEDSWMEKGCLPVGNVMMSQYTTFQNNRQGLTKCYEGGVLWSPFRRKGRRNPSPTIDLDVAEMFPRVLRNVFVAS